MFHCPTSQKVARFELSEKRHPHVSQHECDLQELIMTKNYVLSNIVMKSAYVFFTAAAVLFVCMLLLTRLHP
jgi:hypothetical protein